MILTHPRTIGLTFVPMVDVVVVAQAGDAANPRSISIASFRGLLSRCSDAKTAESRCQAPGKVTQVAFLF